MDRSSNIKNILVSGNIEIMDLSAPYRDEFYVTVNGDDFVKACNLFHKRLDSPVMMLFAEEVSGPGQGGFVLYCAFLHAQAGLWVFVRQEIGRDLRAFNSLSKDMYSASLFEREIKEMFGIEPEGNPDLRRLKLHDEVWPEGHYPLRKDFIAPGGKAAGLPQYRFKRVAGEGIFEIPVGPVHAGIIGPGHFRFSAAGEPIINLEIRLGWTHRGAEKLLEGKSASEALKIVECVSGNAAFGYGSAFCHSIEKILGLEPPLRARLLRILYLELERLYNHADDMGGMALDVGFSFPAQFASLLKEALLQLNEALSGSRYLKGINTVGGVEKDIDARKAALIRDSLVKVEHDLLELEDMLFRNTSFMDRVDGTGILRTKTARDLGITGLAGRASGIGLDLRKVFQDLYNDLSFTAAKEQSGDCGARLKVRFAEAKVSTAIIRRCLERIGAYGTDIKATAQPRGGTALGSVEAWRGPVLIWTRLNAEGRIERCKIVDPSFHNWEGLSYAVLGNIIPDFPLCNKSFDLSYSGNDL